MVEITDEWADELRLSAKMIRKWAPETFPADENGQVHFARAMMESVAETIEKALSAAPSAETLRDRVPDLPSDDELNQLAASVGMKFVPHVPPAQAETGEPELPIELSSVADELADGNGSWVSCTGCHNLNEGVPEGPWSNVFKCHLGGGCRECGGLGAVWDNTDYSDFSIDPAPAHSGEREAGINAALDREPKE